MHLVLVAINIRVRHFAKKIDDSSATQYVGTWRVIQAIVGYQGCVVPWSQFTDVSRDFSQNMQRGRRRSEQNTGCGKANLWVRRELLRRSCASVCEDELEFDWSTYF